MLVRAPPTNAATYYPTHVAVDDQYVYWIQPRIGLSDNTGILHRVGKDGSGATELASADGTNPAQYRSGIALDQGAAFVSGRTGPLRVDLATNVASTRAGSDSSEGPQLVAVDETRLFTQGAGFLSAPKFAYQQPTFLLRDAFSVYPTVMRLAGATIYADDGKGHIIGVDKTQTMQTATVIAGPVGNVGGLWVSDVLYWLDSDVGAIVTSQLDGSAGAILYTQPASTHPKGLALVGNTLFFGAGAQPGVGMESVAIDGSAHTSIAWNGGAATDIASDGTSAYFVDSIGEVVGACDAGPTSGTVPAVGPTDPDMPLVGGITDGVIFHGDGSGPLGTGTPEIIATDGKSVLILADAGDPGSSLLRVNVDGGAVDALWQAAVPGPAGLTAAAIDGNLAYFGVVSPSASQNGGVWSIDLQTKAVSVVVSQTFRPDSFALTPTALFFNSAGISAVSRSAGATAQSLYPALASALTVDSRNIYYNDGSKVYQAPLGGGTPIELGDSYYNAAIPGVLSVGGGKVMGIAATATHVWYTVQGWGNDSSLVVKVPLGGGSAPEIVVSQALDATQILTDDRNVYFLATGDSTIYRLPITAQAGATPEAFATGQRPYWFTMDAGSVYYSDIAASTVTRKHK